jgi:ferrous-iron efflux pump FieF
MAPPQIALMRAAGLASVLVALVLIVVKTWAWLATDSVSLLGSLVDSLLDLIASLITFFAVRVAIEPPDREHRFGHGKSEAIAGLSQAMIVSASALYVAVQAMQRLLAPAQIESPKLGLSVIGASLLLTGALVAFQRYVIARTGSLAVSADSVHYKADFLTNLAVIVAILLNYYADWYLADPLLGLVMVVLILISVRSIVTQAIDVLLDRELPNADRSDIEDIALSHSAVLGLHDMRTRSSGLVQFIQLHLELEPNMTLIRAHEICDDVEMLIQRRFPRAQVMIHADPHGLRESRDTF